MVNREFEEFILASIQKRASFAIETTLRSEVTFDQARTAREAEYLVEMRYIAQKLSICIWERVKGRADAGGHSASEGTLRRIYESSLMNLHRAVQELDIVRVYDNTTIDASHGSCSKPTGERFVSWSTTLHGG